MAFLSKAGNLLKQVRSSKFSLHQAMRCFSSSKVFVGGLSYSTDDNGLKEAFDPYGQVIDARVIMDRETGRSRGFGFVTYQSSEEASAAITALDSKDLHGRIVRVNYATERGPSFNRGGYGGGDGGYGGGGGGYGGNFGGGYGGTGGYGGGGGYGSAGSYGTGGFSNAPGGSGNENLGAGNAAYGESGGGYGSNSGFNFGAENSGNAGEFKYDDDGAKDYANNRG